jgi:hypothetical protein
MRSAKRTTGSAAAKPQETQRTAFDDQHRKLQRSGFDLVGRIRAAEDRVGGMKKSQNAKVGARAVPLSGVQAMTWPIDTPNLQQASTRLDACRSVFFIRGGECRGGEPL